MNKYLYQNNENLAIKNMWLNPEKYFAIQYRKASKKRYDIINRCFFDNEAGFYYNRKIAVNLTDNEGICSGKLLVKR